MLKLLILLLIMSYVSFDWMNRQATVFCEYWIKLAPLFKGMTLSINYRGPRIRNKGKEWALAKGPHFDELISSNAKMLYRDCQFFFLFLSYQMEYLVEYSFGSWMKLILHYFKPFNFGIFSKISVYNVLLRRYVTMQQYMYNRSNSNANKI
jgi:hypothetical protein